MTTEKRNGEEEGTKISNSFSLHLAKEASRKKICDRIVVGLAGSLRRRRWKKQPREHEAKYIRKLKWTVTSCERISKLFFARAFLTNWASSSSRWSVGCDKIFFCYMTSTVHGLSLDFVSLARFLDAARRQRRRKFLTTERQRCTHDQHQQRSIAPS